MDPKIKKRYVAIVLGGVAFSMALGAQLNQIQGHNNNIAAAISNYLLGIDDVGQEETCGCDGEEGNIDNNCICEGK